MSEQHFNALPAGYVLQEYTVKSVLGHGGFGITYLAADNNLGKDVAIKEYLPTEFAVRRDDSRVQPRSTADNDDYEWGLDRFMKEGQTLGLFRHPNIVPVFRAFKENGTAYMVMEYQKGQALTELFRKHRTEFTEEDLLTLVIPLLEGLAVVHKAGYLHRDLKPGNIFIREDGSPVLLDFGAARNAVGRKSKNLTSIVTPGYAPLEQYFADGNQGPWTDIYAIASILYQAVAGRIPPEAPARVKRDPITPAVDAGRGRFSETFLTAIDIGLRVEEEQRPQTVEQWRAMLLGQEVPDAPPPTMGRDAVRESASVRSSATMLAGHAALGGAASRENQTLGGSASMRFPTIAREDAAAHTQRRGMGGGKIAAIAIGAVVLLAASGVGAYIALNPDHGLFGTTTAGDKRNTNTTTVSSDAETKRKEEEARRKADEEEAARKKEQEEADAKRRADEAKREEARRADEKRRADEEAARRREEERRRAEEERKRKEEEARRGQTDEERKRAEEEARRQEEARRREEEARRRDDEEAEKRRRADEERKRREQEEARRREEEERRTPKTVSCDYSVIKNVYASEVDCFFVQRLFAVALTTGQDGGATSRWSNPKSGSSGTIRILSTTQSGDGTMCRRFQQTVTANGKTHSGAGTACYRNNTWQIVS
jgi:hypothetical protein